jgi:hypothetical protein
MIVVLNGALIPGETLARCKSIIAESERMFIVEEAGEGLLKVTVMSKYNDPQWRLPWWGGERQALVADEADAEAYIKAVREGDSSDGGV